MRKRVLSAAVSITLLASAFPGINLSAAKAETWTANTTGTPQYMSTERQMEKLDRGLIAVYRTADGQSVLADEAGVYLSWRLLGDESLENQAFDIYKNGKLLTTTGEHDSTNYIDTKGTAKDKYKVVKAGASIDEVNEETEVTPGTNYTAKASEVRNGYSEKNSFTYVDIPISRPDPVSRMGDGKTSYYYNSKDGSKEGGANDASVGDLDGDGDYEIILKWDPTDSKDSAGADFTGNVYIDAYQADPNNGGYMWRIDLGKNVTAGAHYTQFIVYDFDGDGRSEVAMQTAPGTVDGQGNFVSEVGDTEEIRNVDNQKSYIGTEGRSKGKNLGPEYYTIFDGETGAALTTTAAIPLGSSGEWGDSKYNRSARYLAGVAYLDGIHPSLIECRGYYAKAVIRAYTFDGDTLNLTWEHVGSSKSNDSLYGQGNHNLSIADIDNDGFDEIVYGSAAVDQDGRVMGNTGMGHGDALHVNDFNNDGVQEAFSVKEEKPYYSRNGGNLRVPGTGETLFNITGASGDVGRGVMDNIDDEYAKTHPDALAMGWTSAHAETYDLKGNPVSSKPASAGSGSFDNFLIYWDGDLSRELLDANIIQKYNAQKGVTRRFYGPSDGYTLTGGSTNNYTKRNPSLCADIWGDWREEVIMPFNKSDNGQAYLRIYTSTIPTEYRLATLMHDSQYRCSVAWQNVGYNQPAHQSYYIGSASLAKDSSGNTLNYLAPAVLFTKVGYDIGHVPVTGISLSQSSARIEKGKSESLTAEIEPSDATRKGVTWISSNTSVATVSGGTVTGISPGTATITAKTRDGGFTATCEVEVWSTPVTGISVDKSVTIGVDCSKKISASVEPANASDKNIVWASSNNAIATVDNSGLVTGHTTGAVLITAVTGDGGYKDSCVVNITPLESTDVTGDDVFKTDNTDSETVLSNATANSASLTQTAANTGGNFYRTFDKIDDSKAVLSFRFKTGGQQNVGENATESDKWNWDGHEYSFYLQLLGEDDSNILTLSQAYKTKGENLMSKVGNEDNMVLSTDWTAVVDSIGQVQGSAKNWIVTVEFDYDNDTAKVTLTGTDGNWTAVNAQYTREFELNGHSLEKITCRTEKDGEGTITVSPQLSGLSYTKLSPSEGATTTLYEKGAQWYNAWQKADLDDWVQTGTDTAALNLDTNAGDNGRIYYNPIKPASSYSAQKTFDVEDDAVVTYSADWYFGNSTGRTSNLEYIQFGSDLRIGFNSNGEGGYFTWISTNAGETWNDLDNDGTPDSIFTGANAVYTKPVKVVIDTKNNTIQSLTFDQNQISAYSGYKLPEDFDAGSVSFGLQRGGSTNDWEYITGLESILVSQFVKGAEPVVPTEAPTPVPSPTATPKPSPTATPVPVPHDITEFTVPSGSRISVSAPDDENKITFTNASNANNGYAAAYADISKYTDGETNYDVEFDSYVASSSRVRIALCDTSKRPDGSNKSNYSKKGVAIVHGSIDSSSYAVNEDKSSGNAPSAKDTWIHTKISVDTSNKTVSYKITDITGAILLEGDKLSYFDSDLENINGIEFFDYINNSVGYMKNIKVITYKEPTEPTPPVETPSPTDELTVSKPVLSEDKVVIDIKNSTDKAQNVQLIVVSYDEDKTVKSISLSESSKVEKDGSITLEADAPVSDVYKIMLWDNLSGMKPYMDTVTSLD